MNWELEQFSRDVDAAFNLDTKVTLTLVQVTRVRPDITPLINSYVNSLQMVLDVAKNESNVARL